MRNLYLWEVMTALSIVLRTSIVLFSGYCASSLSSDSSRQVKKPPPPPPPQDFGGLLSKGEFKSFQYRLERISSCLQDATADKHRPVNKKGIVSASKRNK